MNMERQTSNLQFEDRPSLRKKMMFLHKSEVLMSTSEPSEPSMLFMDEVMELLQSKM